MLPLLAIGGVLIASQASCSVPIGENDSRSSSFITTANRSYQAMEDRNFPLRTRDNIGTSTNILDLEANNQLVRTDSFSDIYSVRKNAQEFISSARDRNVEIGQRNFNKRNRKTIVFPNYDTKIIIPNVSTPSTVPFWQDIPGARPDRSSKRPYLEYEASLYNEYPGTDQISQLRGLPRSSITSIEKFGNSWGPGGNFNRALIEGARRGDQAGFYQDYDPKIPRISKRSVQFASGTKLR
jgi:hypothetical protein